MARQNLFALIKDMDSMNMKVMVNLTGYGGDVLKAMTDNVQKNYQERFIIFTNLDFRGFGEKDWTENAVKRLRNDVQNAAKGLKIFKELGCLTRIIQGGVFLLMITGLILYGWLVVSCIFQCSFIRLRRSRSGILWIITMNDCWR
ncbi:MAG: amidohydrolase 2 [Flavisolibacter sp.]|nr:amidohydrolase 2 [Flavisolibacter sp.]